MLKLIEIYVPNDKILPEIMNKLTPEEKYLMIKIGCDCLNEGREAIAKLTQQELTQKIKEETKREMEKLEMEIIIERETSKRCEEKINCIYEKDKHQVRERYESLLSEKEYELNKFKGLYDKVNEENINKIKNLEIELIIERETLKLKEQEKTNIYEMKIETLMEQLKLFEKNVDDIVKTKLKMEMDTNTIILEERNKQIEKTKDTFDKSILNYEKEIEQLNKKINLLNEQIEIYQDENGSIFNKKIIQEREKCNIQIIQEKEKYMSLLDEKQRHVDKIRETYEKILTNNNKSTSLKGSEGEKQFEEYADTFKDFKGFKLIDKHTQGGEGDFHLTFEEFNILADAKNYKKKVPIDQREKIKNDLIKNEHINFGWLVSLNTSIEKFDRAPVMYEWINTKQCLVYINNLSSYEDPTKILRIVWFTCKELFKLIKNGDYDEEELVELKEKKYEMLDKIKNLRKNIKEANTSLNTTKNIIQLIDDQLKELLDNETNEIVESNFSLFDTWWNKNIEVTDDNKDITNVTDVWFRFKQENKDILKEFDITVDKFKGFLKTKVPSASLIMKNKNINSAFDIKGIKIKDITVETEQANTVKGNNNEDTCVNVKSKIKKQLK